MKQTSKRASPGTRLKEIEKVILGLTLRLGRGVTAREIREAYLKQSGEMDARAINGVIVSIERQGRIVKVGGRHRRTQYAHVDHPVRSIDPEDPAPVVLDALADVTGTLGRAASSSEVTTELRSRGQAISIDQVRATLGSLAHASVRKSERSARGWGEPTVIRLSSVSSGGKPRVFWTPTGGPKEYPSFANRTDAIRFALQKAGSEIGRPLSAAEVERWARGAQYQDSVDERRAAESALSPGFRRAINRVLLADQRAAIDGVSVRGVRTPLTGRGRYPLRMMAGEPAQAEVAACFVEDLAGLLQPADELGGIAHLRDQGTESSSSLLEEVAWVRETLLRRAFLDHAPSETDPVRWILCGLERACEARRRLAQLPGNPGADQEVLRHLEATRLVIDIAPQPSDRNPVGVHQVDGIPFSDLERLAREAYAINDRHPAYWSALFADVRRIRSPLAGGLSCDSPDEMRSRLDRVDAWSCLISACHLPVLGSLAMRARSLLGGVLRDSDLLLSWLKGTDPGDEVHSVLVMALGLLGAPAPIVLAWPDARDSEQAAAYLAAVSVGVDDENERFSLALDAEQRARGAACEVAEMAVSRLEGGARLTVVG